MTDPRDLVVLIDVQALQGEDPERGIPRWLAEFSRALRRRGTRCVGLINPLLRPIHPQFGDCFDEVSENHRTLFRTLTTGNRAVYIVGSVLEPVRPIRCLLPDHVIESGIPIACVMYDLALYRYPEYYQTRFGDGETYAARKHAFQWCHRYLAISESTARDVNELWRVPVERIAVVGTGVSEFFESTDPPAERPTRPFVMTVGRRDPRKQTGFLIRMFAGLPAELRSQLDLVVVCRLDHETEQAWRRLAHEVGLAKDQLVLTGIIDDTKLRDLYRTCEVFVEPSLFEGFGLPLAEAAACGAVAICSNSSSLPEIIPSSENLFDPADLSGAIELLQRAITDLDLRDRLKHAARQSTNVHRWDAVASRAQLIIEEMATEVSVPQATVDDYLARGYPRGALGRTIPLACIDE